jgi:hypothetical protein
VEAVLALASEDITPPIMAMPMVPGDVSCCHGRLGRCIECAEMGCDKKSG